jgi:DNA polymerase-3 subunit gamma/tau
VQSATRPQAAAEMVLVRIAYVSDLPTPDEAIKMIDANGGSSPMLGGNGTGNAAPRAPSAMLSSGGDDGSQLRAVASSTRPALDTSPRPQMSAPAPAPVEAAPARRLNTFAELVALAGEKRDLQIKTALEADVRLVRIEDGKLEVSLERSAARSMINDLSRKLEQWTGRRWTVIVSNEAGEPTLRAQAQAAKEKLTDGVQADPRVQAVMSRFPGTQLVEVRRIVPDTGSGADESGPVAAAEEDDDL